MSVDNAAAAGPVAYVVGTYPLLTTTFIDREIRILRQMGLDIDITALRRPHGRLSADQQGMVPHVRYVLPVRLSDLVRSHLSVLIRRPAAFLGTLAHLVTRPHASLYSRMKTVLHFGEGVHVASMLRGGGYRHIHAHFVDRAATVALVAGRLLDLPFSATAHANDIYVSPALLVEKLSSAAFVATCTRYNADHLQAAAAGRYVNIACIYHGLDVDRYQPTEPVDEPMRPTILAVGQLKEKKGFRHLITACAALRERGHDVDCRIVGEGPDREPLQALIRGHGLDDVVDLLGALPHQDVIAEYRAASLFTLPCVVSANGDRDGLPNVILEAMAMQLPVVSSRLSGIPEAVIDGETGILVSPEDPDALADALEQLLVDPSLRADMGRRGRQTVVERFDVTTNVRELLKHFQEE
jgi:glycosyltransferase involved in cell wall biosynthesis